MYFGSYACITELILVFQILYLYYETYSCILDLILVIQILFLYKSTRRYYTYSLYEGTRRYYWTYAYITEVPIGTTEILSLSEAYTEVPVGITEIKQIQRYP